jgi:predicted secreted protein
MRAGIFAGHGFPGECRRPGAAAGGAPQAHREEIALSQQKSFRARALGAVVTAALLAGCGQSQEPPATAAPAAQPESRQALPEASRAAPIFTLTDADTDRAMGLQRGQVVEIRLPADRVSGFTWLPAHNPLPIMGTDGVPLFETDADASPDAPGTEVWRFVAREPGHAHVVFEYRRPHESGAPPRQTVTYHFDVE